MHGEETREKRVEHEDVEELREVLNVISEFLEKLPGLVKQIIDIIFSRDIGEKVGASVGAFYKQLLEAGVPKEEALKLTVEFYETTMSVSKLIEKIASAAEGKGRHIRVERS